MLTLIAINPGREGIWKIHYKHECDCGCTTTRHILIYNGKKKPTDNKAKQLIDADYNQG